ncbi:hypothetical protein PoB_006116600 [Plakobranchus ocellatus]|uniref:Uncharacterized protein n=1 Tax=Plakobranchus ocellatus TaxID=259542 RepID=A0AAV4CRY4_9GAST|nr:hypothetical protein PoB_006116600 [Plakobranchus ocellatus]
MFYKFNNVTQRLASATQDLAIGRPVSAESFSRTVKEEPKIVYDFKPAQTESKRPASHAASRLGPGQYAVPNNKTYKRLMELQTKFTADDGKLVWQKMPKDMPLYYLTVGLVAFGTLLTGWTLAKLATPPKND